MVPIAEPKLTPDKDGMKDIAPPGWIICDAPVWKARPAGRPEVVLKVVFVQVTPPAEGGQGASAVGSIIMGLLAAELTQAKTVWALAFCGPASSRPMAATLARGSLDIESSIC